MGKGPAITDQERGAVKALHDAGKSNRAIAKQIGRSECAVRNVLREQTPVQGKVKRGRPKKLTERDVRRVFKLATWKNYTTSNILNMLPSKPSKSTVLRVLRSSQYVKYARRKPVPSLKPHHKKARIKFAEKYSKKNCVLPHGSVYRRKEV